MPHKYAHDYMRKTSKYVRAQSSPYDYACPGSSNDIQLNADSATVYSWLKSIVFNTHNAKTRELSEALIKRRLDIIQELIAEMTLNISLKFVQSSENVCRVSKKGSTKVVGLGKIATLVVEEDDEVSLPEIRDILSKCHFGTDRNLELVKENFGGNVPVKLEKMVADNNKECSRIDLSLRFRWRKGRLATGKGWE